MSSTPRMLSDNQKQMLADIFRIVVKEIASDEDKENLAPGEMGISYTEGSFYIKNPYTGELFCPNSLSHLQQILAKYNPTTGKLNSDYISGVKLYTSTTQLSELGISLTADTVIRQMTTPSILISSIEYTNFSVLQYPSQSGLLAIIKLTESFVTATFYDYITNTTYDGLYNGPKHLLEGWFVRPGHGTLAETTTAGDRISATSGVVDDYHDLDIITLRVTDVINPDAFLSVNGRDYLPIIDVTGNTLASPVGANIIMMVVYDDMRKSWVYCPPTTSTQTVINRIMSDRYVELKSALAQQ